MLTAGRYCDQHERANVRERDARVGSSSQRGYDVAWRRLRVEVLIRDPWCRVCGRAPSTEVDHIVPESLGGTDDLTNLQGLCKSHYAAKTARDDGWGHPARRRS